MKRRGYHPCPRCSIETIDSEFCPDCEQEIAAELGVTAMNQTSVKKVETKIRENVEDLPRTA